MLASAPAARARLSLSLSLRARPVLSLRFTLSVVVLALAACAVRAAPSTLFISASSGSDTRTCTSSADACATLTRAIAVSAAYDVISVAPGVYASPLDSANVSIPHALTIVGGNSSLLGRNMLAYSGSNIVSLGSSNLYGGATAVFACASAAAAAAQPAWSALGSAVASLSVSGVVFLNCSANALSVRDVRNVSLSRVLLSGGSGVSITLSSATAQGANVSVSELTIVNATVPLDAASGTSRPLLGIEACASCAVDVALNACTVSGVRSGSAVMHVNASAPGSAVRVDALGAAYVNVSGGLECRGTAARLLAPRVTVSGAALVGNALRCSDARVDAAANVASDGYLGGGALHIMADEVALAGVLALNNSVEFDVTSLTVAPDKLVIGGGAVLAGALLGADDLNASVLSCSFADNHVRAVGLRNTASSGSYIGGGSLALLTLHSMRLNVSACSFARETVVATGAVTPNGDNYNGGAGVYVVSSVRTEMRFANVTLVDQFVEASQSVGNSWNINGGAAIYAYSDGIIDATLEQGVVMLRQLVVAQSNVAANNLNGGAGFMINPNAYARLRVARGCVVRDQVLFADHNIAATGNYNGGAGINVAPTLFAEVTVEGDVDISGQVSWTRNNSASQGSNYNGGAGLYVNAFDYVRLRVADNVTMSAQAVYTDVGFADTNVPTGGNANGGGAVYVYATTYANVTFAGGVTMAGQVVQATGHAALQAANFNGGGAVYVYANESFAFVSMGAGTVLANQTLVTSQSTAYNNFNGGGALFVLTNLNAVLLFDSVLIRDQRLDVSNSTALVWNICGGGGVYVYSQNDTVLRVSGGSVIAGQSMIASNGRAPNNLNGGAGIMMNPSTWAVFNMTGASVVANQTVYADNSRATLTNSNGGAGINVSPTQSAFVHVDGGCTISGQALWARDNVVVNGSNYNGGAGLYVNSFASVQLHVSAATLRGHAVYTDRNWATLINPAALGEITTVGNVNGGAGIYVFATATASVLLDSGTLLADQHVRAVANMAPRVSNANGGAALYVNTASGAANVTLSGGVVLSNQSVELTDANADLNFCGGAGIYVLSYTDTNLVVRDGCALRAQTVHAARANATAENFNGGAGVYVNAFGHGRAWLYGSVVADQFVDASDAYASDGNYNGGAGVYVNPLLTGMVFVSGSQLVDQTVAVQNNTAAGVGNFNGGAAVYLNSVQVSAVTIESASVLSSQLVNTSANSAVTGSNNNGGGGVYVYCQSSASVLLSGGVDVGFQVVDTTLNRANDSNVNGGGAVYVYSAVLAVLTAERGTSMHDQRVDCSDNVALVGSQFNGGGGFYVNARDLDSNVTLANTTWLRQVVVADRCVALGAGDSSNFNGGAAVYANSFSGIVAVSVLDSSLTSQVVSASNNTAPRNANGGVAVYTFARQRADVGVLRSVFAQQRAAIYGGRASRVNSNGGGGIYVATQAGRATLAMRSARFVQSQVVVADCVSSVSSSNGGGAFYVNSGVDAVLTLANCSFEQHAAQLTQSRVLGGDGAFNGGGAGYVLARTAANVSLAGDSFDGSSVTFHDSDALGGGSIYNGGAALLVNALFDVSATLVDVSVRNSTANATNVAVSGGAGSVYLGGAVYVLTRAGNARLSMLGATSIAQSQLLLSSVTSNGNAALAGVCGGASVFVYSQYNAGVFVTGSATRVASGALVVADLVSLTGDWYIGSAGVLAVSAQLSAYATLTGTSLVELNATIARVFTTQRIVAGGGALLVVGDDVANASLSAVTASLNSVALRSLVSSGNQVVSGGGALSLAAVNPCQSAAMLLSVLDSTLDTNVVRVGLVDAPQSVVGGGAIIAASAYAQLGVVMAGSTFRANGVLRDATDALLVVPASALNATLASSGGRSADAVSQQTLGGGALLINNQAIIRSALNKIELSGTRFFANWMQFNAPAASLVDGAAGALDLLRSLADDDAGAGADIRFTALGGGALLLATAVTSRLEQCALVGNIVYPSCAACSGGAALLSGPAELRSVQVSGNSASHGGGLALQASAQLYDTEITLNAAFVDAGGVLASAGRTVLTNCTVSSNGAVSFAGGVSASLTSVLVVNASRVVGNAAASGGGGSVADAATLAIIGGTLVSNNSATEASGGCFAAQLTGLLSIDSSTLADCQARQDGGAIMAIDASQVALVDAVLSGHVAQVDGGCVAIEGAVTVAVVNSTLSGCSALHQGGGLSAFLSPVVSLVGANITACSAGESGGGMYVADSSKLSTLGITVSNCSATRGNGGGIHIDNNAMWSASGGESEGAAAAWPSRLVGNRALGDGGGLYVTTAVQPLGDALRGAFSLVGNVASRGAGVSLAPGGIDALLENGVYAAESGMCEVLASWQFVANAAVGTGPTGSDSVGPGSGGALFFDVSSAGVAEASSEDAEELNEEALASLVAFSATVFDAQLSSAAARSNNATGFGPWAASTWARVRVEPSYVQRWPGGVIEFDLWAMDAFNQTMVSLQSALVGVECEECLVQSSVAALSRGHAGFSMAVSGEPNATIEFIFGPEQAVESVPLQTASVWHVKLGACPPGSGPVEGTHLCSNCSQGLYSRDAEFVCQPCPTGMLCLGAQNVYVQNNYWPFETLVPPASQGGEHGGEHGGEQGGGGGGEGGITDRTGGGGEEEEAVVDCSSPNATCIEGYLPLRCPYNFCEREVPGPAEGAVLASNESRLCSEFRDGASIMCGRCEHGYAEWNHVCVPCHEGYRTPAMAAQLFTMSAFLLLQFALSQQILIHGGGTVGFLLVVFLYQFGDLAVSPREVMPQFTGVFDLNIPPSQTLGCPFDVGNGYGSLVVSLMTPVVYFALLGLFYLVHKVIVVLLMCCMADRKWVRMLATRRYLGDMYLRTIFFLLLNLFETVVKAAFSFLVCVPQANVVFTYPTVSCVSAQYAGAQAGLIVLIALLCVGFPLGMALALLRYKRKHGSLHHIGDQAGALFHHYKDHLFWWESVQLVRRAALLAVFVPLAGAQPQVAKAALALTVTLFTILHIAVWPYVYTLDNVLEVGMLATLLTMVTLGLALDSTNGSATVLNMANTIVVLAAIVLMAPIVILVIVVISNRCRGRHGLGAVFKHRGRAQSVVGAHVAPGHGHAHGPGHAHAHADEHGDAATAKKSDASDAGFSAVVDRQARHQSQHRVVNPLRGAAARAGAGAGARAEPATRQVELHASLLHGDGDAAETPPASQ